jgi:hypothetical protein
VVGERGVLAHRWPPCCGKGRPGGAGARGLNTAAPPRRPGLLDTSVRARCIPCGITASRRSSRGQITRPANRPRPDPHSRRSSWHADALPRTGVLLAPASYLQQGLGRRTDPPAEPAACRKLAAIEDNQVRPMPRADLMGAENSVKDLQHRLRSASGPPSQRGHIRFLQVVACVCVLGTHRRAAPVARHESWDRRARDSVVLHCARPTHGNHSFVPKPRSGKGCRAPP